MLKYFLFKAEKTENSKFPPLKSDSLSIAASLDNKKNFTASTLMTQLKSINTLIPGISSLNLHSLLPRKEND